MENKAIILLLVIFLLFGLLVGYSYPHEEKQKRANISPQISNQQANPNITVETISEQSEMFDVRIQYPQFTNVDSSFNKKISESIKQGVAEFKSLATENWNAMKATATAENPLPDYKFSYLINWYPVQINENYISFYMDVYFFAGGAHGDAAILAYNYDVKNKKEISFSDFIGNSQTALERISKAAIDDISNQRANNGEDIAIVKEEIGKGGAAPKMENFNTFTFGNNLVTIYFQKYQVGPGVMGTPKTILGKEFLDQESINSSFLK